MTFEEAIDPAHADPFDTTYAWCFDADSPYHTPKDEHVLLVDISDPSCYVSFGMTARATVQDLTNYLHCNPWASRSLPAWTSVAEWFVGSADDLVRQVKQRVIA